MRIGIGSSLLAKTLAASFAALVASSLNLPQAVAHSSEIGDGNAPSIIKIKIGNDRTVIQRLAAEGYDIAGVNLEAGTVDVIARAALGTLDTMALISKGLPVVSVQAVDHKIAPDSNYKTPEEIANLMHAFAEQYPHLVHIESIGQSHEGRDIWAVKISDNPEQRELDEPAILFNAMHHAREVMTPEVALDTIEYLLTNYGSDEQATHWVDSNEIWIVAMLNVDGNNKVWSSSSMWRKNTRGGYGVDINRNYPHGWASCNGSSGSTWSDTYRGPSAGSEPETQALMNLVARIEPVFNISYHSYSEIVIYPYGCSGQRVATRNVVEQIGRDMASKIARDSGRGTYEPGTSWELLYSVDGGDIDWMYHTHNVIPYVIEVNSDSQGFQPAFRWRQPTVEKLRPAWSFLLDKLDASGVRGVVTSLTGEAQAGAAISVASLDQMRAVDHSYRVKADGTYHIVLNPGRYRLTFSKDGAMTTRDVTIDAERLDLDVEL